MLHDTMSNAKNETVARRCREAPDRWKTLIANAIASFLGPLDSLLHVDEGFGDPAEAPGAEGDVGAEDVAADGV